MKNIFLTKDIKVTNRLFAVFVLLFAVFFSVWLFLLLQDPGGSQRGVLFIDSRDFFMDWFNTVYYAVGRIPYSWGVAEDRNYLPIIYMILYPFTKLYPYDISEGMEGSGRYDARYEQLPMVGAVVFIVASYLFLFYVLYRSCRKSEGFRLVLLCVLFLSGVSFNSIERMNIQVLTSAFLFAYVYLCDRDELPGSFRTFLGLLCLAFAAVFKLFPAIFGILLLYKKRWREAVAVVLLGVTLTLLPFAWVDAPFLDSVKAYMSGTSQHSSYMAIADFGFSTPMIRELLGGVSVDIMQVFACIMLVLSIAGSYFVGSGWKRIALLSLPLILTSGQSGYYCLMFMFLPIVMFFNEEHCRADLFYIVIFVIILSPLQRTAYVNGTAVSAKGVINIALIILNIELVIEAAVGTVLTLRGRNERGRNSDR